MTDLVDALAVLRERFGHAAFRPGQATAIEAVLAGRDAAVLLPTGAGKSSCYQVPAVVAAERGAGVTIVVSPLIALMNDQVEGLRGRGLAAAAIHSQEEDDDRREALAALGRGDLVMVYVSPERAVSASFKQLLGRARVAMLAIDEAHCVSQWGHDFRPEYQRLHELRAVTDAPVIALTATATPRVMAEISRGLALRDPVTVRGDFRRPNLSFEVQHHRGDESRLTATIEALERAGLRQRAGAGRGIVYCSTRKKTEAVAAGLKAAGFAAGHYHAGRTGLARDRAQAAFSLGRLRVLVATSAFGMGVDYPDVRAIVHFQAPGSLEAYYQEAGRAGRDGEPGHCLMLFGAADMMTQRRIADGGGGARHGDGLAELERYANAATCRQQLLCAYFTGTGDHAVCDRCDACIDPEAVRGAQTARAGRSRRGVRRDGPDGPDGHDGHDGHDGLNGPDSPDGHDGLGGRGQPAVALGAAEQQVILAAVAATARRVGRINLAKALHGSQAKTVVAQGLERLPQHGALAAHDEASIVATIDQLIRERRLVRRGRKYPTIALPGPARSPRADRGAGGPATRRPRSTSSVMLELDSYRKRMARQLKWKAYMVLQRGVIAAIDQLRPTSREALARIPGLGPAKIARFGDDILAVVRRQSPQPIRD